MTSGTSWRKLWDTEELKSGLGLGKLWKNVTGIEKGKKMEEKQQKKGGRKLAGVKKHRQDDGVT